MSVKTKKDEQCTIDIFFKSSPKTFEVHNNNDKVVKNCNKNKKKVDGTKKFYIGVLKKKIGDVDECVQGDASKASEVIESNDEGRDVTFELSGEDLGATSIERNVKHKGAVHGSVPTIIGTQIKTRATVKRPDSGDDSKHDCTRTDCIEMKCKYKALQKNYAKLAIENAEMSMKYKDLSKTFESLHEKDDEPVTNDGFFLTSELEILNRFPTAKRSDSTFIRNCLEFVYQDDLTVLASKSAQRATERNGITKMPLTPSKVKRIKEVFVDRLNKCKLDPAAFAERVNDVRINQLLASGIKNIVNKTKEA